VFLRSSTARQGGADGGVEVNGGVTEPQQPPPDTGRSGPPR